MKEFTATPTEGAEARGQWSEAKAEATGTNPAHGKVVGRSRVGGMDTLFGKALGAIETPRSGSIRGSKMEARAHGRSKAE